MEKKFINCEYIIVYVDCSFESNSELFYVRVINSLPNKWDLFSGNEENIILIKYIKKKKAFVSFHSSNVTGIFPTVTYSILEWIHSGHLTQAVYFL